MGHFLGLFGRRGVNKKSPAGGGRRPPYRRALAIEPLEDRRLLTVTVNTLIDEADGSIVDGDISLRDAIALAPSGETINFDPALTAGGAATLNVTMPSAITIAKALTIAGPGAALLTIDASANDPTPNVNNRDGHRLFNITDGVGGFLAVTIQDLTLTGADINGFGGAIDSAENLTLRNMVIRGNSAQQGAGVGATGPLSIFDSQISDNVTSGTSNAGAGIHLNVAAAGTYQIVRTTVSNNQVTGTGTARGGGIFAVVPAASSFKITDSAVIGNSAPGDGGGVADTGPLIVANSVIANNHSNANGGGIKAVGNLTVDGSLIDGNTAAAGGGVHADAIATLRTSTISNNTSTGNGGGVVVQNASSVWTQDTISGNKANGSGGGVYATQKFELDHGTIVMNVADFDAAGGETGGGIFYTQPAGTPITLKHTILAGNLHGASTGDDAVGPLAAEFSLIGISDSAGLSLVDNGGNQKGTIAAPIDPLLAPLAANDGPALHGGYSLLTHSLLLGSPAIDAGDPAAIAGAGNIPVLDERGSGFTRVYNATGLPLPRIDIGALELQPSALIGDYNFDGVVSAADYTVWRNTLGSATDKRADGNRDGTVNIDDFTAWKTHYGETLAMAGAASGASLAESSAVSMTSEQPTTLAAGSSTTPLRNFAELVAPSTTETGHASPVSVNAAQATASNDDALLAWLALSTSGTTSAGTTASNDAGNDLLDLGTSDGGIESLDSAFAGLGAGL